MYPENLAKSLKVIEKIWKNVQLLPFNKWTMFTMFQKFFISWQAHNKIFNLDSEYPHIHNASKKETQTQYFWSQEPAKIGHRFFSHKWAPHWQMPGPFYLINHLLMPDALEAFEMNKSNGGVQRRQKDTIIQPISRIPWQSPKDDNRIWGEKRAPANSWRAWLQCGSPSCQMHTRLSFENNDCCMACILSKQDSLTKFPCSKVWFGRLMNVFFYPSFTANSILLRWWVWFFLIN